MKVPRSSSGAAVVLRGGGVAGRDLDITSGYDLALVTADPNATGAELIARYAARWAIAQAFADAATSRAPVKPTYSNVAQLDPRSNK